MQRAPPRPFLSITTLAGYVRSCLDSFLFENAIFFAERIQSYAPSEDALLLVALTYARASKWPEAYTLLSGKCSRNGALLLARACYELGKYSEGADVLMDGRPLEDSIPQDTSSSAAALFLLGRICMSAGLAYASFGSSAGRLSIAAHSKLCLRELAPRFFQSALERDPFLWAAYEELCTLGLIPLSGASSLFPRG